MRLAIDIGNTAIKVGRDDGAGGLIAGRLSGLGNLSEWLQGGITFAAISSVVPEVTPDFMAALHKNAIDFQVLDASNVPGLKIEYQSPETVGSDRLANALVLSDASTGPAIAVDFGTATKLDVVDGSGAFLGGAILPGAGMMMRSLHKGTAKLPEFDIEAPKAAIGRSTRQCLLSGTVLALAKAVDGLIEGFEDELGSPAHIVATGGAAGLIAPLTTRATAIEPNLTLQGLLIAARRWSERN